MGPWRREQKSHDVSWNMDILMVTEPDQAQYRDDLTGEPLDSREVTKARKLDIVNFRQM